MFRKRLYLATTRFQAVVVYMNRTFWTEPKTIIIIIIIIIIDIIVIIITTTYPYCSAGCPIATNIVSSRSNTFRKQISRSKLLQIF
jgi:hypothetical protein